MLKLFTFLLAFFTITVSSAQNLVQNPSFEDHISCPDNDNQVPLATGWRFSPSGLSVATRRLNQTNKTKGCARQYWN